MENQILKILTNHQGHYISGQDISEKLHVSRMTISTYIKGLKEKGYQIETSTKKGYCLTQNNDIIFIDDIKKQLHPFYQNIDYFDEIESTNQHMKSHAYQQGDIIIADSQTNGKGRNGRSFYSPKQKGIYLSFMLKPTLSIYDSLKITACCAVAAIKAIQKNYPLSPQIKWVNDIMINDFKVAGILCEATIDMNTAQIETMIVGIGINVHHDPMPADLQHIAGCLEDFCDKQAQRLKIIIDFLNIFYDDYTKLSYLSFLDDYRRYSYVLHQDITVYENNTSYPAYVSSINDDASLTLLVDGKQKILKSGEVSIRKTNHQQHT